MTNVGTGHWIFAGIFAIVFVGALVWSYSKDKRITQIYYNKSLLFTLSIIVALFLMFVFRKYLR
jgi:hypothetical protein